MSSPEERIDDNENERAQATADDEDAEGPGEDLGNDEDDRDDEEDDGEDDDEDEDEDEDGDEIEEAERGPRRKRRRRERRNQFLDVEAEVDEDEEEEDEEDDEGREGFVADTHPDDEGLEAADMDDRRHRQLDLRRQREDENDYHAMAERLDARFATYGKKAANIAQSAVTPRSYLVPSVEDPRIWAVSVKPGKEREVVYGINKRVFRSKNTKTPIKICSVFERGKTAMAGYIYVEAYQRDQVIKACDGISFCFVHSKQQLLNVEEMPDLLRVKKQKMLEPGMFVRIKRGKYDGDLAQVDDVDTNGLECSLKIVPRLDYGAYEEAVMNDATKRKRPGGFARNSKKDRPPARLFSETEARKRHSRHVNQNGMNTRSFTYFSDTFMDGFLVKDYKLSHLETENVNPKIEEVTVFAEAQGDEGVNVSALASTMKSAGAVTKFSHDDNVEVFEGEQKGVKGKIKNMTEEVVSILVTDGPMSGRTVDAPQKTIRKIFNVGDHVKVIASGKFENDLGSVLKISGDRVTMVRDKDNQEITLFSRDMTDAAAVGVSAAVGGFSFLDMVKLDAATMGCVISATIASLEILTQTGQVRTIPNRRDSATIVRRGEPYASGQNKVRLTPGEVVREVAGAGRIGRIVAIHNNVLFLHNSLGKTNQGVFVLKPSMAKSTVIDPAMSADKRNDSNPRNGGSREPPRAMGKDWLVGKSVTIRGGEAKGLLGIVRSMNGDSAIVEIHSRKNHERHHRSNLLAKDPVTGKPLRDFGAASGGSYGSAPAARAPSYGNGQGYGAATPRPAWDTGARTPAFGGGQTPGWAAAGNRTAYGGVAGGRTPGWKTAAAGGRTAYGGGGATAYGGATSYGGGTAYGGATSYGGGGWDGSRTPAGGAAAAATPGGFAADTPAANAYTPAAAAATPGGYAQTPGASGQGDEGYED